MGLFVAAVPELVEENRKNKEEGKNKGWRKEGRGGGAGSGEGRGMSEREGTNVHVALKVSPMFYERLCAPQLDLEVVPSCAWRQQ